MLGFVLTENTLFTTYPKHPKVYKRTNLLQITFEGHGDLKCST